MFVNVLQRNFCTLKESPVQKSVWREEIDGSFPKNLQKTQKLQTLSIIIMKDTDSADASYHVIQFFTASD